MRLQVNFSYVVLSIVTSFLPYKAYCSISRPAMSLKDHSDMAYAMNSIALHSQFVDDLDEVVTTR